MGAGNRRVRRRHGNTMNARDAVSASLAECYITIEGNRYNLCRRLTWKQIFEKNKSEVPILGKQEREIRRPAGRVPARRRSITIQVFSET